MVSFIPVGTSLGTHWLGSQVGHRADVDMLVDRRIPFLLGIKSVSQPVTLLAVLFQLPLIDILPQLYEQPILRLT
jgi:hypothetical protein